VLGVMFMVLEFSSSIRRDEYVSSPSAWSVQGINLYIVLNLLHY